MLKKIPDRVKAPALFLTAYTVAFCLFAVTLRCTFPFLVGFGLALAMQPVMRWLKKVLGLPPGAAAFLATTLIYAVLLGMAALLGFWLALEISALAERLSGMDLSWVIGPFNNIVTQLGEYVNKIDSNFIRQNQQELMKIAQTGLGVVSSVLEAALGVLTSLPAIVTTFTVMVFSTYFFSKDMSKILRLGALGGAAGRVRSAGRRALSLSCRLLRCYLALYFITFLETLAVFSALRAPYPLVLSLLAGAADILPVLGPGTVYLPLALAFLAQGRFFAALALLLCWLLICAVRQMLEPKIVSVSLNTHPLYTLAALYLSLSVESFWVLMYLSLLPPVHKIIFNKPGTDLQICKQ